MRAFRTLPAPKMGPSPFCTLYPYAIANSAGITVPLSPPNPYDSLPSPHSRNPPLPHFQFSHPGIRGICLELVTTPSPCQRVSHNHLFVFCTRATRDLPRVRHDIGSALILESLPSLMSSPYLSDRLKDKSSPRPDTLVDPSQTLISLSSISTVYYHVK